MRFRWIAIKQSQRCRRTGYFQETLFLSLVHVSTERYDFPMICLLRFLSGLCRPIVIQEGIFGKSFLGRVAAVFVLNADVHACYGRRDRRIDLLARTPDGQERAEGTFVRSSSASSSSSPSTNNKYILWFVNTKWLRPIRSVILYARPGPNYRGR